MMRAIAAPLVALALWAQILAPVSAGRAMAARSGFGALAAVLSAPLCGGRAGAPFAPSPGPASQAEDACCALCALAGLGAAASAAQDADEPPRDGAPTRRPPLFVARYGGPPAPARGPPTA